jgi:hypothetical protein
MGVWELYLQNGNKQAHAGSAIQHMAKATRWHASSQSGFGQEGVGGAMLPPGSPPKVVAAIIVHELTHVRIFLTFRLQTITLWLL